MTRRQYDPNTKIQPLRPDPAKDRAEIDHLRDQLTDLIQRKPDKAAIILTDWLKNPAPRRKKTG